MSIVLSRSEIERMKSSLAPPPSTDKSLRKNELKKISEERQQHWPNTLEAMRKKKESFVKDREEKEELKRQEIDRQEAELRKINRLESIRRANELLYEQTDKMKMLKSQKLYADVIHTRQQQIGVKQQAKTHESEIERAHHEEILKQVQHLENLEHEKVEKRKQMIKTIGSSRQEQLDDLRQRKEAQEREEKAIGQAMKEKAKVLLEEDFRAAEENAKWQRERNAEMVVANEKIKAARAELKQRELLAILDREKEHERLEDRKRAQKAIEIRKFEKSQEKRQVLIDAAVRTLESMVKTEEQILMKQETEVKEKEARLLAEKEAQRAAEWQATVISRTEQIMAKQQLKEVNDAKEALAVKIAREERDRALQREREDEERAKESVRVVKQINFAESINTRRKKVEDRILQIEQEQMMSTLIEQDDQKFATICKSEIESYAKQGKPVLTLFRALEHSQPDLLGARLEKVPFAPFNASSRKPI